MRLSLVIPLLLLEGLIACTSRAPGRRAGQTGSASSDRVRGTADATAVKYFVYDGDVWVHVPPDTGYRQLTRTGLVREAKLSPDQQMIAYVLDTPGDTVQGASGPVAATALWIVHVDGTGRKQILHGHDSPSHDHDIADIQTLRFSPDQMLLYFSSEAAAVQNAVHVVNLESGQESYVCLGDLGDVVPRGRYAGDLIVGQHRYLTSGNGSYDAAYLLTPRCDQVMRLELDSSPSGYDSVAAFYTRFVPPRGADSGAYRMGAPTRH